MLLWTALAAALEPTLTFEWRPLGRGDVLWVDDGLDSGLAVGGLDGFVRPPVQLDAGAWVSPRVGLQASLGLARLTTTAWTGDVYTQRHHGVVRPGVDARWALIDRQRAADARWPLPWLLAGAHVDIPSARDVSNGYTDDAQAAADEVATAERARLGALGLRAGPGVEQRLVGGLSVGAMYTVGWQRSLFVSDDPTLVQSWVSGEAALLLLFDWPEPASSPP